MPKKIQTQVAVIGAGNIGIATAYYLAAKYDVQDVLLIDAGTPMEYTSAQSGENYRNWWPHPSMVAFMDHSIDLMEEISLSSNNRISMSRRGYALATRTKNIEHHLGELHAGLGDRASHLLRFHEGSKAPAYLPAINSNWKSAPTGVDIIQNQALIRETFPSYTGDIQTVIHIRRGGDISGQQLGMYMLEKFREARGRRLTGKVVDICLTDRFCLNLKTSDSELIVEADQFVNAAGPFAGKIANMISVKLPIHHTFQQKIAFEDTHKAIPRKMPFSIDLDPQFLNWSDKEKEMLLEDDEFSWLAEQMPGAIHCRPDGGEMGSWMKIGWAYNHERETPTREMPLDNQFPEIVLRGAARLNPALNAYCEHFPSNMHHYGGWYTMTEENWPLIGPMGPSGAYMNCAQSGFGTMAACASGELCAAWVAEAPLPSYAKNFSSARYLDQALMKKLINSNKGIL